MIHQVDDPWGESVADQALDDTSIGEKKTGLTGKASQSLSLIHI